MPALLSCLQGYRVRKIIVFILLLLGLAAGGVAWWASQPLRLSQEMVDLEVTPGEGSIQIAREAVAAGVQTSPELLSWWLRLAGQARGAQFKAGTYEIKTGDSPRVLLRKLSNGEFALRQVRIGEGWNLRQARAALAQGDHLRSDSAQLDEQALLKALERKESSLEGLLFPDTYKYAKNASDMTVLRLAMRTMDRKLEAAWASRDADLPYKNPYEMLIMASIIEKETGRPQDRAMVASVFVNRLRIGMRLQTDPTVIYGIGDSFDGNLRKIHLQTDTPYNTYTRAGLPPTPISMPGEASLAAAAHPASSKALYFVARGDGSSEFSDSLDAHNRAVNKYIRGR